MKAKLILVGMMLLLLLVSVYAESKMVVDDLDRYANDLLVSGGGGTSSANTQDAPTVSQDPVPQIPPAAQKEVRLKDGETRTSSSESTPPKKEDAEAYVKDKISKDFTVEDQTTSFGSGYNLVIIQDGKKMPQGNVGTIEESKDSDTRKTLNSRKVTVTVDKAGKPIAFKETIKVKKKEITLTEGYVGSSTIDGQTTFLQVTRIYGGDGYGLESTKYTLLDKDGRALTSADSSVTLNEKGEVIAGNDNNEYLAQVVKKYNYNRVYTAFQRGVGWSAVSSLFCGDSCFGDWALQVDKIFHDAYLGSEYWTEALCKVASDIDQNTNAIYSTNADGLLFVSGVITATRQTIIAPQGTRYLYKVSFFFRNPEQSSERKKSSSSKGTIARGSSSSSGEGLDREEKSVWNSITKNARKIESSFASASPRSSGEDIDFNIIFEGERTIELFTQDQVIEEGDEISVTQDDSVAAYSNYRYTRVCLIFPGEKPTDAFYEEIDELCTDIKEVKTQPTTIEVERSSSSRSSSGSRDDSIREI